MGLKERREREREERKRQILNAARSLLFEEGLQGTSINKIAKSAELGVGTIYSYFASKEEIFAVLQEEGIELLHNKIKKRLERVKRLKTGSKPSPGFTSISAGRIRIILTSSTTFSRLPGFCSVKTSRGR